MRRLFALIAPLLVAQSACAQSRDIDPPLWVVRDADTTIYLFGTVHWLKPGLNWFDDEVRAAFDASDTLVLEIVDPDPKATQDALQAAGAMPDGPPLPDRLPPGYADKLAAATAAIGYAPGAFDRTKPWLVATTLSVLPLREQGYSAALGVEPVLHAAAQADGKTVTAIETARGQWDIYDRLPFDQQLAMLTRMLDHIDEVDANMETTIRAWAAGDMAAIVAGEREQAPKGLSGPLVDKRNAVFADWIAARMATPGTVFVAVGAGHLAGPGNVRDTLATRGYSVPRVAY